MKSVAFIIAVFLFGNLRAQNIPNECATPYNFPDPLRNVPVSQLQKSVSSVTTMMRMYIHILRDDNGTNQAMQQTAVENEVRVTDSVYNQGGICFAITGVDYINSSTINNDIENSTFTSYLVPNCFNVFVVTFIPDPNGTTFGTAFAIPNNYIAIVPAGFGPRRTFMHELGHDLGLFHTFHGQPVESDATTCKELVNGSNGISCGDLVGDTPADPYQSTNANTCNSVTAAGAWNGTCKDANNQLYAPDTHNFMGYWPNYSAACDRNFFSNGQFTRMQNTITNTTLLSDCIAPNNLSLYNSSISSGKVTQAARDLLQVGNISNLGNYTITASTQAYFSSTNVILKPGFLAQPNSSGLVRMIPAPCQ